MNIFYCITFLHFGAGRALLDLAKEAVSRGHRAMIAATRKIDQYESQANLIAEAEQSGISVMLVDDIFTRDFSHVAASAERFMEVFAREKVDLIHSHAAIPAFAASLASKKVYGRFLPHLSTVHAWSPDKPAWMKLQDTFTLNNVDRVHAVSHQVGDFLREEGVEVSRIRVVYNGCNFARIEELAGKEVAVASVDGIARKKYCIGTVADLSDRKGINDLLDAVALLPDPLRGNMEVVIVGDGTRREMLISQARRLGIERNVNFIGFAANPFQYLASFDLFILPSLSEGLPVSLVEAMYLNVPVLATDVQGNREILQGGKNGMVTPARDSRSLAANIGEFFEHRDQYQSKVKQARNWVVRNFNRDAAFDQMFRIYEDLAGIRR